MFTGRTLVGVPRTELRVVVESVVDLRIDLFAAGVITNSEEIVGAVQGANPPETGCIQTIADVVVVRNRHLAQHLIDESGRVLRNPVSVPGGALDNCVRTIGLCRVADETPEHARIP